MEKGAQGSHVAIVVLSWNGRDDTLACLDSLAGLLWQPSTVIVVDNGSSDGTAEAVRAAHPDLELIRSDENLGFAEGNNLGIRRALELGADYVLLLNNDTIVDPDLVGALVREAERRPDAGALSPIIYYADPPDLIWYAGADYDPRRGHNGRQGGYGERDRGQYAEAREITRASGAAMLVPRPVLEDVGQLDGDLFLHVEDTEWSLRMRRAGYRLYFAPGGRVWHKVSADTGGEHSPALAYYGIRNTLEVCARYAELGPLTGLRRHVVTVAAQLAHARRSTSPLTNICALVEGWRDYRRGRLGPRGRTIAAGRRAGGAGP